MQLGDYRIGVLHCQLVGCPYWGESNVYGLYKE